MPKIFNYTKELLVIVFQVASLPFAVSVGACVTLYVVSSSVLMCAISTLPWCASSNVISAFLPPSLRMAGLQFCLQLAMATRR